MFKKKLCIIMVLCVIMSVANATACNKNNAVNTDNTSQAKDFPEPLLTSEIFADDSLFELDSETKVENLHYESLAPGKVVKTADFNGICMEKIIKTKTSSFQEDVKSAHPRIFQLFCEFDQSHPEVFWLNGKTKTITITVKNNGAETAYVFFILVDSDGFSVRSPAWQTKGSVAEGIQRRETAIAKILSQIPEGNPAEQITAINRLLIEQNAYNGGDLSTLSNEPHESLSALEGSVGESGPVCDGYSRAFKVLCDRLNIPCVLVSGQAKDSAEDPGTFHMWDAVQVDGQWYYVDVTWNDPKYGSSEKSVSGYETERYLLVGSETKIKGMTFAASHVLSESPTKNATIGSGLEMSSAAFLSNSDSERQKDLERESFFSMPRPYHITKIVNKFEKSRKRTTLFC